MTTQPEFWLLDTNVWVLGLRRDLNYVACRQLLDEIGSFHPLIPLQVLKELNAVLSESEMQEFYKLVNDYPDLITFDWTSALIGHVKSFENRGCKKGDAVIAAHAEQFGVKFVVTENRKFLQTLTNLPFKIITPRDALVRLQ